METVNTSETPVVEIEAKPPSDDDAPRRKPARGSSSTDKAPETPTEPRPPCFEEPLSTRIEALLISTDRQLSDARLGELLGIGGTGLKKKIEAAVEELNEHYRETARSFRVERLAGGWQILTDATFGPLLARLHEDRQASKLSQAALETLSIIAYRQPILRAEIEAIRGVACGEVLRGLIDRRLVKISGRAEELGRPMLYGTTREFLTVFGLASVDDLPTVDGLIAAPSYVPPVPEPQPTSDADGAEEERGAEAPTPAEDPASTPVEASADAAEPPTDG